MARKVEAKRRPHLRDLFDQGRELTIEVGGKEYVVWIRPPTVDNHEEAMRKAGAKQARLRQALKDKDSDEWLALAHDIENLETREELEAFILGGEEAELKEQAFNDILYGEWGSNWSSEEKEGQEGLDYYNVLEAYFNRQEEIKAHNAESSEKIKPEEDPDLQRAKANYDKFQAEVDERLGALRKAFLLKYQNESDEYLRKEAEKRLIDILTRTVWYEEYNAWMTHLACRDPDNHKLLYFNHPSELAELPTYVQSQLVSGFQEVSRAGSDLKALSTPENSSDSSAPSEASAEDSQTSSQTA